MGTEIAHFEKFGHRYSIFYLKNAVQRMIKLYPLLFMLIISHANAQKNELFGNRERMELVKKGGRYIYNQKPEAANEIIAEVKRILPDHPIGHLMDAFNISWQEMPLRTTSPGFPEHKKALELVIETSQRLQDEYEGHEEGVFFESSARGLLAEYYAREGSYLKALSEARKMYALMKKGFEFAETNIEFKFHTGLYNYFREMYPQRHPVYKPFMWVFKTGSIEKGIMQMDSAANYGILTKIEASLYLSYIYLRYENQPDKALGYLNKIVEEYPNNDYFKAKLVECYVSTGDFNSAMPFIEILQTKSDPYYKMCGEIFYGMYLEKSEKNLTDARSYYEKGLNTGKHYSDKGLYYRSLAHLGLGRIADTKNDPVNSEIHYRAAIDIDENDLVTDEARKRLKNLK